MNFNARKEIIFMPDILSVTYSTHNLLCIFKIVTEALISHFATGNILVKTCPDGISYLVS